MLLQETNLIAFVTHVDPDQPTYMQSLTSICIGCLTVKEDF